MLFWLFFSKDGVQTVKRILLATFLLTASLSFGQTSLATITGTIADATGAVLVGDAAGWNDPILGLGLSITYRDVRIVSDILKAEGATPDFRPYAEERAERMRRLRLAAEMQAGLDMEFGEEARERRRRYHAGSAADPSLGMHGIAVLAGPEAAPPETFTAAHRARVLGA